MNLLVGCMQIDASIPGKITYYGVVGLNVRAAGAHASAHFPELLVRCT